MYQREEEKIKNSVDWLTIAIYMVMVLFGWVSIYGASYQYEHAVSMFDLSGRAGSQLIWIGTSLIIGFTLLKLDSNVYDIFAYYIYFFFIALLVLTIFIAPDIKGSRSWIAIPNTAIRIQPAEFAKFAVALTLAKFMSAYNFKLLKFSNLMGIAAIIVLPIILILLQKETGSALVYTVFILVLYREGLPGIILLLGVTAIVLFVVGLKYSDTEMGMLSTGEFLSSIIILGISTALIVSYRKDSITARNILLGGLTILGIPYIISLFNVTINWGLFALIALALMIIYLVILAKKYWSKVYLLVAIFAICSMGFVSSVDYLFTDVMQPHQQKRIKVTLGMEEDLMGAGYNVNQSKIAIGSGGFLGKGFLNGTQTKLKYVPEQDTDFIFCTVGEEQGFVGSVAVVVLFTILILRLFYLAERQRNTFGRVYGYSVACIILFHVIINIGMVIGLTPVIGIPLPFFSYGGSSLWAFTILLFIFLRIDMARKRR